MANKTIPAIQTNEGNVGIGVTSPRALLDLAKANNVGQVLLLGEVGANVRVGFGLHPSNAGMRIFSLNHVTDGGIEFGGISSSDGSTWTRNHRLGLAGGNSFFNEQGGNVGIGTNNPSAKLEVAGSLRVTGVGQIGPAGGYGIALFNDQTNTFIGQLYGRASGIQFTDGAGINTVYIASGGKVGIGTTNPLALLSVGAGSLNDGNVPIQISSAGPTTERWIGVNRNGSYGLILGYYEGSAIAGSGAYVRQVSADPLHFAVNNTSVAMSILSNTNIGIGTTNPSQKLDVNGAIIAGINNSYGAYTRTPGGVLKPWFATASANTLFYNTNVSGSIFWQNAADSATLMILTDQARLGINTNVPSGRLHVLDTVLYPPSLTWNAAAATIIRSENGQIAFGSDDAAPYGIWQQVRTSSSTARPLLLNPLGGNVGVGVRNPTKKLQVAGSLYWDLNGTSAEEHIVGIQRVVAAANGAFTEIGTLAASPNSIRATFEIFHHDSGTIEYSLFELIANYYTGTTTDWVQLPSRTQAHYAGVANGVVVDARLQTTGGSVELRLRSIGGASGAMTVNVRIKSNTNLTETSATGTGATVAGLLGFNGYEFPVTNNRFKATVDGLFIKNNGNIGIGTTNPATLLHVDTAGADARIRVSAGTNTVQGGMIANTGTSLVYAGSITNHGFSLRTNDTDRVRIDTNGNVGIGTLTLLSLLSVGTAGSTTAANGITLGGDAQANLYRAAEDIIKTDATLQVAGNFDGFGSVQAIGSILHRTTIRVLNKAATDWVTWFTRDTSESETIGRLDNIRSINGSVAGNLGIGTTLPSGKLHVVSSVANDTVLRADGTNGTLFSVVDDLSDSLMSVNNSAGLPVLEVFADDRIVMGQYGSGDLVVKNNEVGIGTTNPINKLSVIGNASIGSSAYNLAAPVNGLLVEGSVGIGTTSVGHPLEVYGTSMDPSLTPSAASIFSVNSLGVELAIGRMVTSPFSVWLQGKHATVGGNLTYPIVLNPLGGNVGIGTTNAAAKLDIRQTSAATALKVFTNDTSTAYIAQFIGYDNSLGDTTRMVVQAGGSVGIGRTNPSTLLSIGADGVTTAANGITFGGDAQANIYRNAEDSLATDGNFNAAGNVNSKNSRTATYTSITSGTNGTWYPLFAVGDSTDATIYCNLRTFAHGSVSFIVARGYNLSNTHNITILNSQINPNGGYANVTGVRIRQDGGVEIQLSWSSGPAVDIGVQIIGTNYTPPLVANLTPTANGTAVIDSVVLTNGMIRTLRNIITEAGSVGIGIANPTNKLHIVETTPTGSRIQLGSASTNGLMNAGLVNDFLILTAPFNAVPASTSNNNAKWGIKMGGGSTDSPNALEKSACIYAVSEEDIGAGGAGAGYNRKVGLALHTSPFDLPNVERVRINNLGNVGIGLTNPAYRLQVSGGDVNIASANILRFGTVSVLNTSSNANDIYANIRVLRNESTVNTDGMFINYNSNGTTAAHLRFYANATNERMRIDASNGYVGVGTTVPDVKFDVYDDLNGGNISAVRNANTGSNAYTALVFRRNGNLNGLVMFTNSSNRSSDGGLGNSTIRTDNGKLLLGAGASTYHALETDGNVGIGLTNPAAARLHIKGNGTAPVLRVETADLQSAAGGTAGKTFVGWMPIMTGAAVGDKVFIPLYK